MSPLNAYIILRSYKINTSIMTGITLVLLTISSLSEVILVHIIHLFCITTLLLLTASLLL